MSAKISVKKVFLLGIIALFSLATVIYAQETTLRPNKILTVKNSQRLPVSYKIEAAKGQVISLEIKQNGMDIAAKLFDNNGLLIAESDNPFSEQDVERIFAVANETGDYRLELRSKFLDDKGSFNLKLNELRTADPNDFKCAEAEKLFAKAQIIRSTGKTVDRETALKLYDQSLILRREIDDKTGELRTLAILSYLNRLLDNDEKSLEIANQILQFPDSVENNPYKADALYQIGQMQFLNGKFNEAVKTYKNALSLFASPSPQQANIYSAMGNCYQSFAEFELAETAFNQSLDNINQFPDIYSEAQTRHTLGLLFITLKDWDSAIINLKIAADLREKFGNRRGLASSLSVLGMCYANVKNIPASFEVLEKALPISQELGDKENIISTLAFLAVNYRESGNPAKAVEILKQSLELFPDKGSVSFRSTNLALGVTLTQLSNFSEARPYFEKALNSVRRIGDLDGETRTLYQFAKLERAENNLDAAKIKLEHALEIHEYVQAKYHNIRSLSALLELRRGYFDLYIDVLMRLDAQRPNENFAFKAFQVSESARMRTLIWQLREAVKDTPQSVDFRIITDMQKAQQQIGEQLALLAKAQSNINQSNNAATIETTISGLIKQVDNLKAQLRESNPNVAALAQPPTLSLAEMQAELDDDGILVEYSLGEQRSYLWIVGKNSFRSFVLPKRAEIELQAKIVYEILSRDANAPIRRTTDKKSKIAVNQTLNFNDESAKLSRMLAVENFTNLAAKRLIFVTDGTLNYIPFASLNVPNTNNFIGDKFEIAQLPSLTTLHILRQRNIKPFSPESVAVIADPIFSLDDERLAKNKVKNKQANVSNDLAATLRDFSLTKLSRLPFSRREAENIARIAPHNTVLNLDFKANRERILNGNFDNFDVLHFATHGFLNNEHPELSGLVLSLVDEKGNSQNGFLRTQDLFLLKLKAQMIVLSACQTGLGKQVENEGLVGLTRGFLANGTPRIISGLWKVDDTATSELMTGFYRAMFKENQSPSAALRIAQNELKAIPRFSHPRYWAGFVLTGEWR